MTSSAKRSVRSALERSSRVASGDRVVLIFAGTLLFTAVLRGTGAPGRLQLVAIGAGIVVWHRYRWMSGGRERFAAGVADMARTLEERRDPGGDAPAETPERGSDER